MVWGVPKTGFAASNARGREARWRPEGSAYSKGGGFMGGSSTQEGAVGSSTSSRSTRVGAR